uniref:Protein kinase domain-containing protein n=1 Tax=Rousettus aegyptiacus TaxID=9407 RepID=A0A7J8GAM5_ROUAE|nr:hypothetical protein HJG63_011531 [Rousettus aegyptiacus]
MHVDVFGGNKRVIILICSSEDANIILLAAENLGLNTGEFVFIVLQQLEAWGYTTHEILQEMSTRQDRSLAGKPCGHLLGIRKPSVLQEIRLVYELRHENIIPFFGICTKAPNTCIITQYCKKGSLKDVLRNSDN